MVGPAGGGRVRRGAAAVEPRPPARLRLRRDVLPQGRLVPVAAGLRVGLAGQRQPADPRRPAGDPAQPRRRVHRPPAARQVGHRPRHPLLGPAPLRLADRRRPARHPQRADGRPDRPPPVPLHPDRLHRRTADGRRRPAVRDEPGRPARRRLRLPGARRVRRPARRPRPHPRPAARRPRRGRPGRRRGPPGPAPLAARRGRPARRRLRRQVDRRARPRRLHRPRPALGPGRAPRRRSAPALALDAPARPVARRAVDARRRAGRLPAVLDGLAGHRRRLRPALGGRAGRGLRLGARAAAQPVALPLRDLALQHHPDLPAHLPVQPVELAGPGPPRLHVLGAAEDRREGLHRPRRLRQPDPRPRHPRPVVGRLLRARVRALPLVLPAGLALRRDPRRRRRGLPALVPVPAAHRLLLLHGRAGAVPVPGRRPDARRDARPGRQHAEPAALGRGRGRAPGGPGVGEPAAAVPWPRTSAAGPGGPETEGPHHRCTACPSPR